MTYNPGMPPTPPPPPGAYGGGMPYGAGGYVSPPPEQPIMQDVACRKCGYNLRGLTPSMRCPECGTAVGYSLQGDLLRFCDPEWVETLARGARMIVWGVVVIIIGIVLGVLLAMATARNPDAAIMVAFVVGGAMIVGRIMMIVGWWLLTQPDPSGLGEDQYGTARKIIRVALVVGVISQILNMVTQNVGLDDAARLGLGIVQILAAIVEIVGFFAQLTYLHKIALRVPDMNLSGRAYFLRLAIPISYGLLILFGILSAMGMARARGMSGGAGAMACLAALALLAVIVFAVMYLFLLISLGTRFKEAAQIARTTWAASQWAARGAPPRPA